MSKKISTHNQLIQSEFTKQASAYSSNPTIIDPDWAQRLVRTTAPNATDRVLDIATGPGYVALAFASNVSEVIGIDLTDAPLAIATKNRDERGITNVQFEKADANKLPFDDASFDVIACRLAFHHMPDPAAVLAEMVRVCRVGGKISVEDLCSSEAPERGDYQDRWERLRDPSHTDALSLSELSALFTSAELEIENVQTEHRPQVIDQWLNNSQTPADVAEEVRGLLRADEADGLSGMHVYTNDAGEFCFDHRVHTVVGIKRAGS